MKWHIPKFSLAPFLVAGLAWAVSASARDALRPTLSAHLPPEDRLGATLGRLPAERRLSLAIGLPWRQTNVLTNLLRALYDPADPQYHQYLTADQFAAAFGPSEADYQAVQAFARARGLSVIGVHPNRMVLNVSGTVADLERALHLVLRTYQHPKEDRVCFAPDSEPTLELAVPVLHITGLTDLVRPQPSGLHPRPPGPGSPGGTPEGGSGLFGAYEGGDFRAAYAPGVGWTGAGQMVGLLQFDGYYASDVAKYCAAAGISAVPLINVYLDGYTGSPIGSGNLEAALDIDMVTAMAPGLTAILVYQTSSAGYAEDILNRMATDNLAKQLSASWSFASSPTVDQIFQEFAAQGQSFFIASGDQGAAISSVAEPADDPLVTSVGGTTMYTAGPRGAYAYETTWSWFTSRAGTKNLATGGGISPAYTIPPWQQHVASLPTNGGSLTMRNFPDVAMVADAIIVYANSGRLYEAAGTSAAAPLWAAFTALVNQQAAALGQSPVGFLNPALYALGQGTNYGTVFHDVTLGNNTNLDSPTLYFAGPSYDLCTGWGSPTGQALIDALAPRPNAVFLTNAGATLVAEGCLPTNGVIDPGESVTVLLGLQNLGAVGTTNLVATLQADSGVVSPSGPQTYGALPGNSGVVSLPFTFTANGTCGGTLVATLRLQDGPASLGRVTFACSLGKPAISFAEAFDGVTAPALPVGWASSASGAGVPWVTTNTLPDTRPNAVWAAEAGDTGVTELLSPPIPVTTASAQLTFRNSFNTEVDPADAAGAYDGGVLEIAIGGSPFADILAAGGSFAAGGYNRTLYATNATNPLAGRAAWAGLSGGFITTTVNLPAAAAGQSVQFKWRLATDGGNFNGGLGWSIDTVSLRDGTQCCASFTPPTIHVPNVSITATNVSVALTSVAGVNYTLQFKNALTDPAWTSLLPVVPGNGGVITLLDPNPPSGRSRFYRLSCH